MPNVEDKPLQRECEKTGFPHAPARGRVWKGVALKQGDGETRFPHPLARWEGVGELCPQAGGWGNPVSPDPHPVGGCGRAPPAGRFGRAMPSSRGVGQPGSPTPLPGRRVGAGAACAQGCGATGFPHPLTRWEGVGGHSPWAGVWGNRVSPDPHPVGGCGRAMPSSRGTGKPGFSRPSPGGRVWAGAACAQGSGETRFPQTLTRWEGAGGLCSQAGVGGNRVSPYPHPVGGCGRAQPVGRGLGKPGFPLPSPGRRVWEGVALSGTTLFITAGRGAAA